MKETLVLSFAKINLSIDMGALKENGFHDVDMVMQQLSFHDDVKVAYIPFDAEEAVSDAAKDPGDDPCGSFDIEVKTNRYFLPTDERNLAYKAALLMIEKYGGKVAPGKIRIDVRKRIPVAGGLAGGSGNGAAVLHALDELWDLGLSLDELNELGAELGSDVPFCVMGQAKAGRGMPKRKSADKKASTCMRATGRGTELTAVKPLRAWVVIAKPKLSVSTKEVYQGMDSIKISKRPDNERLIKNLEKEWRGKGTPPAGSSVYDDFVNVLEEYTLTSYPEVAELKKSMEKTGANKVLMSGSGPTVFAVYNDIDEAKDACLKMRGLGYEAYWTRTTV